MYEVREGDILLTSKGSALKIAIVENGIKNAILSSNLFLIRLNQNRYKPEILKHYFESKNGQELLYTIMKGAVIKSISNKELEALIIPNIDISKQCSISEMILQAKNEYDLSIKAANEKFMQKQSEIEKLLEF